MFGLSNETILGGEQKMLDGIVVVEFGRIFSAPLAGMILSDLGAKVIKIERKGSGDESRHYGMKMENDVSDYFYALNRNKEVISLDLKNEQDLLTAKKILESADILIHNSLQKSFDALGLSYEVVKEINPRMIYTAISGYGAVSRYNNFPSQDVTIQGLSGFMSLNGFPDGSPLKTGVPVVDYVTGQNAVVGIMASLIERGKTGKGKFVNVSLLESALSMISVEAVRYLNINKVASRNGNRHNSIAPYNSYKTKDGYVLIAIANDAMFERFANVLSIDFNEYNTNEKRLGQIGKLEIIINERTARYTVDELIHVLKENKISCEPINDIAQAFNSEEIQELNLIGQIDGMKYIKTPINFS